MTSLRIGNTPQLLVDDHIIDRQFNVTTVMHQPRKYPGNPILRAEAPAEGGSINLYGTVLRSNDDGSFKMWYQGYAQGAYHALYATSHNGIFWQRPNLGQIAYAGNRENNLISTDMAVINVLEDPTDPEPQRRFKCLHFSRLGSSTAARACVSFSPDGTDWTLYADNPVLDGTSDTHTLLGWDERIDRYVAYIRPGIKQSKRGIRVIGRSESEDFLHWSPTVTVLEPDEQDPPAMEFYGMSAFKLDDIYYGLLWAYHAYEEEPIVRMEAETDVQLAVSRDGIHWKRVGDRNPFIPRGDPGAFDSKGIYTAKAPVVVGDELWFYYGGAATFHGVGIKSHHSLGLAKLRRNGFVSIEPIDGEGWIVTQPFICDGTRLSVNAEAGQGYVMVAVLDAHGHQLPGFHRIDSVLVDGRGLDQPVTWREHNTLATLQGESIRLKFYLRRSCLYSFQII